MADATQVTFHAAPDSPTASEMIAAANAQPIPALSVRSVNVVIDSHNKSPNGFATEIVEVEAYPAGLGNAEWMQWCDVLRFRCERGKSSALLELLGLKPSK